MGMVLLIYKKKLLAALTLRVLLMLPAVAIKVVAPDSERHGGRSLHTTPHPLPLTPHFSY